MSQTPPPNDDTAEEEFLRKKKKRQRLLFLGICSGLVVAILLLFRAVLLPFFLALIVAYVLEPVCSWLERVPIRGRKMPRWVAVIVVYTLLITSLSALVTLSVPRMVVEIQRLAHEIPAAISETRDELIPKLDRALRSAIAGIEAEDDIELAELDAMAGAPVEEPIERAIRVRPLVDEGYEVVLPDSGIIIEREGDRYLVLPPSGEEAQHRDLATTISESLKGLAENTSANTGALLKTAQGLITSFVKGIFTFTLMLMLSAYILVSRDAILNFFRSLVLPRHRGQFDDLIRRVDRGLAGVVRGQLLIALVNGVLSGIGFYLFDLRYWPILTLIATAFSIVPIFGAILSSIPAVLIGLQQDFMTGFLVLVWIVVIHQIEANLLNPKIMGDAAKVHPVLVVFALLGGEHLFGIAGALLAVPTLSVAQSLFLHFQKIAIEEAEDAGPLDAPVAPQPQQASS